MGEPTGGEISGWQAVAELSRARKRIAELEAESETRRREHVDTCKRVDELEAERDKIIREVRCALSYVKGNSYMAQNVRGVLKGLLAGKDKPDAS